jgi:predicted metal-dependent phosphoesterase TrpH
MNTFKVDLHTHSIVSPDGGITEKQYKQLLDEHILDVIAVTDHNRMDFALDLHQRLGDKIIVGEEILTSDGEMIGLFLQREIVAGLSAKETATQIKKQGGIVLIPHPFETLRHGISGYVLESIHEDVDAMEVFNSRSMEPATREVALQFVHKHGIVGVADSDAHCQLGIGTTYNIIDKIPDVKSLVHLLQTGERVEQVAPWLSFLCPAINKLRKRLS